MPTDDRDVLVGLARAAQEQARAEAVAQGWDATQELKRFRALVNEAVERQIAEEIAEPGSPTT